MLQGQTLWGPACDQEPVSCAQNVGCNPHEAAVQQCGRLLRGMQALMNRAAAHWAQPVALLMTVDAVQL